MKLLILTQKVDKNDSVLGFFHRWIEEFAKNFESVIVICLCKGEYKLPSNVKVLSLGKENGVSRIKYLFNFYKYIITEKNNYDKVFVHMNQVYAILGGLYWKIIKKDVYLWYTHRAVSVSLRLAIPFIKSVFTAAKESFNLKTSKLIILGIGIDFPSVINRPIYHGDTIRIISVGRITRIKNLDILIEAISILNQKKIALNCKLIGPMITNEDKIYQRELADLIAKKGLENLISFVGEVPFYRVGDYFLDSDININLAPTGGVDKVVLEGIVYGSIPLVKNEAFRKIFGEYSDKLIFKSPDDLVDKFVSLITDDDAGIRTKLFNKVKDNNNLSNIIRNMANIMIK